MASIRTPKYLDSALELAKQAKRIAVEAADIAADGNPEHAAAQVKLAIRKIDERSVFPPSVKPYPHVI
jgi:hypothetical protein